MVVESTHPDDVQVAGEPRLAGREETHLVDLGAVGVLRVRIRFHVVGDSIHDVACGRSLGVRAVAVATGITSTETLAAERPDALFESFADTDLAFSAIVG